MTKLTTSDFIKEFQSGLSAAWKSADLSRKKTYSLFELYVVKLMIEAAISEGAIVRYCDGEGKEYMDAWFRTGPHQIYDKSYPYVELHFSSRRVLEIHTGVKSLGKSGIEHECDIAVLRRRYARSCRKGTQRPQYDKLIASVECKFYTSNIHLGMSREFVGLTMDLTEPKNQNLYYVVSTAVVDNGKALLNYHQRKLQDQLLPKNFIQKQALIEQFKQIFQPFNK